MHPMRALPPLATYITMSRIKNTIHVCVRAALILCACKTHAPSTSETYIRINFTVYCAHST